MAAAQTQICSVYSHTYLETETSQSWAAIPSSQLLASLFRSHHGTKRWIASVKGGSGSQIHIALGDPVRSTGRSWSHNLYIPQWLLGSIGLDGIGEEISVAFHPCEEFSEATSLQLKVIGDIPSDMDVRDLLEEPLSQLGVLSKGQMLPLPVLEGYLFVSAFEPEGEQVFLHGHEVALHIESDKEQEPDVHTPQHQPQPPTPSDTCTGMLPSSLTSGASASSTPSAAASKGHSIGHSSLLSPVAEAFLNRRRQGR